MNEVKKVDLSGLSCPEPALRIKGILKETTAGAIEVIVNSGTARDNVERIAERSGWNVAITDTDDGGYILSLTK